LKIGRFHAFITPGNGLNAHTFGLTEPQAVVVYDDLLRPMDADELRFILGHELGHVRLGHT
jgi:Zn-dependent protease with chaperone function